MNSAHPALFPSANLGLERGKSSIVGCFCFCFCFLSTIICLPHLRNPPGGTSLTAHQSFMNQIKSSPDPSHSPCRLVMLGRGSTQRCSKFMLCTWKKKKNIQASVLSTAYGSGILKNPQCSQSLGYPFVQIRDHITAKLLILAAKKWYEKHTLRQRAQSPQQCRARGLRPIQNLRIFFQLMLLIT